MAILFSIFYLGFDPNANEVMDLTESGLIWETTVTVNPNVGPNCPPSSHSTTEQVNLLCQPDPYDNVCESYSNQANERQLAREAQVIDVERRFDREKERIILRAKEKFGQEPSIHSSSYESYAKKVKKWIDKKWEKKKEQIDKEIIDQYMSRTTQVNSVKANFRKAKRIMSELIDSLPHLRHYSDTLKRMINCEGDPILDTRTRRNASQLYAFNYDNFHEHAASCSHGGSVRISLKNQAGRNVVNPMLATRTRCETKLTLKTWLDCAEGRPVCFQTLFHEFGHILNSCHLLRNARWAWVKAQEQNRQKRRNIYLTAASEMHRFYQVMKSSSHDCLNLLSAPSNPIRNTCTQPTNSNPYDPEYRYRCGDSRYDYRRSQWNEAESDFWGAAAMSRWLKEIHPGTAQEQELSRSMQMMSVLGDYCRNTKIQSERPRTYMVQSNYDYFNRIEQRGVAEDDQRPACRDQHPSNITPHIGVHQARRVRMNRNVLRNSAMREALNCPVGARTGVPTTCTVDGNIRTYSPISP